jgi:cell pole-organizing protein PopZ
MSESQSAHEPSMEEILASIRRIISDNDEGGEENTATKQEVSEEFEPETTAELRKDECDNGGDMAAMVKNAFAEETEVLAAQENAEEDIFELTAEMAVVSESELVPEQIAATAVEPSDGLVSSNAQATASAAFGSLSSTVLSHSGCSRTLEQIAEDLLRPFLKDWLDENLPTLVERMVREEIERVARHVS